MVYGYEQRATANWNASYSTENYKLYNDMRKRCHGFNKDTLRLSVVYTHWDIGYGNHL